MSEALPAMKMQRIGVIDNGCDGSDEYILVTSNEDDITIEQVRQWLLPQFYREPRGPGGYYCHDMSAQQRQYRDNEVIAIIYHRYDV